MTKLEQAINRLIQDNASEEDLEYMKTFSESTILNTIRSLQGDTAKTAQGKWNPEDGRVRNGKFYGKD